MDPEDRNSKIITVSELNRTADRNRSDLSEKRDQSYNVARHSGFCDNKDDE